MSKQNQTPGVKVIARNKKAYHDYHIIDTIEAGMVLTGTEIKSIRLGRVNLRDAYVLIRDGEAWLINAHIAPYPFGNRENHEPRRERKLLLHRREIARLLAKVNERGYTIVPLRLYLRHNKAKIEIALVKGKRLYDKREAIARRDADRDLQRTLKHYR
ncbi:MAG: SsrA-binding protein SmpB [Chloroflexi bacterium]|nr:SsrA-binding protein SmpB [Chloroflexota bacterium]